MKQPNTLSLEGVRDEPIPFAFELSYSLAALDREPLLEISPVRLEGKVVRVEGGYCLEAQLSYQGRLECSRCLAAYPFETEEQFSMLLFKRTPVSSEEVALEKQDLDAYFYEQPAIAVAPIAEERIQMAIPMKPLCREDCGGLCPHCGQDLNLSACGCGAQLIDPRWDALAQLKKV
ncbi:MAG TPA: DUF177 domain-containing protein [Thermoanaerobaculia bacterium]|nr:DUF177 domain-containing protein [Thermoanaerobaculia bacterium]